MPPRHPADPARAGVGWIVLALVVCFLAACVAYAPTLDNGFAYDDQTIIVDNALVTGHAGPGAILNTPWWGSRMAGGLYRPFTIATFGLDHRLHGLNAAAFHRVNMVLHGLVSAMVLLVALEWLGLAGALAAGLLFAIHPIHSEAVANVVGRAELLAALGLLLAWWLEPRAAAPGAVTPPLPPWARRVGSALAFGVALFSKEVALAWLPLGLALAVVRRRRIDGPTWLMYGTITIGYLALRLHVLGALGNPKEMTIYRVDNVIASLPWPAGLWTALGVFGRYLTLLLFPWRLTADYSWPMIEAAGPGEAWAWLGLLGLVVLVGAAGVALARARGAAGAAPTGPGAASRVDAFPVAALAVGLATFFITFLPVSNFGLRIGTVMAERLLYLPSVGFLIMVGALLQWAWWRARGAARPALMALLALVTVAGAARCMSRSRDWHDDLTLHAATARSSPRSARAHANLGIRLMDAGRGAEARVELERAVALDTTYVEGQLNLGGLYAGEGRLDDARRAFQRALAGNPGSYTALVALGGLELRDNRSGAAVPYLDEAVRRYPRNPEGWAYLGLAQLTLGDTVNAVASLRNATRLNPNDNGSLNNLAWCLAVGSAFTASRPEAVELARHAVGRRADAHTLDTLAEALARAGRTAEALEACRQTLAAGGTDGAATRERMARLQSGAAYPR